MIEEEMRYCDGSAFSCLAENSKACFGLLTLTLMLNAESRLFPHIGQCLFKFASPILASTPHCHDEAKGIFVFSFLSLLKFAYRG